MMLSSDFLYKPIINLWGQMLICRHWHECCAQMRCCYDFLNSIWNRWYQANREGSQTEKLIGDVCCRVLTMKLSQYFRAFMLKTAACYIINICKDCRFMLEFHTDLSAQAAILPQWHHTVIWHIINIKWSVNVNIIHLLISYSHGQIILVKL